MNLQDELKALKERIAELEELAKEEQEFPQVGDEYWYLDNDGVVMEMEWRGIEYDQGRLSIDNVFKTKEQAEFATEKLKVEAELRKFSRPFEVGKSNTEFYYWHESRRIMFNHFKTCQMQGSIYFESEEKAQQAIETVGEERIKKYIFGVED